MRSSILMFFCFMLWSPALAIREVTPRGPLDSEESNNIRVFEMASKSVVHITTADIARDFFSLNVFEIPKGSGSGFFWDEGGHIVTNFHVIRGGRIVQVMLTDQSSYRAQIIGVAPEYDLAVLKVDLSKEKGRSFPLPLGDSATLKVGQKVFAIGNPFGLDQTLTRGIVSAIGREINSLVDTPIKNVIQTDAAINPGNSGGPLLDSAGRLIGVNTAIYSPSGASSGIGFAIPSDSVNWVVSELIKHGKLIRPSLGASFAPRRVMDQLGMNGALVLQVDPNGAAAEAGLIPTTRGRGGAINLGDIIVSIDQHKINYGDELLAKILSYKVGDKVKLTVLRGNKRVQLEVTLKKE